MYNLHTKAPEPVLWKGFLPLALFITLPTIGVSVLLYFWTALLKPENLGTLSLPLVAFTAGLAASFNPCALPALPAFFTLMSGDDETRQARRFSLSVAAGLGTIAFVLLLGLLVAGLGEGLKPFVRDNFRWVQLAVGALLVLLAGFHLGGQTARLPVLGAVMDRGHKIWDTVIRNPTPGGSFIFGSGFVLVGVG